MDFFSLLKESLPLLGQGLVLTLQLSALSLAIAMVLGIGASLLGMSKHAPLRGSQGPSKRYPYSTVSMFRPNTSMA